VEYGCPVEIEGVTIRPGDLLFCDSQGIVAIPDEVAHLLAAECRKVAAAELPVLEGVRRARLEGRELDVSELMGWVAQMQALRAK
jgi:regulator of RNase E activity RraA